MQRDLRFYFSSNKQESQTSTVKPKKKRVISSDEDDTKTQSPVKRQKTRKKSNKSSVLSDSEWEENQKIINPLSILCSSESKDKEQATVLPSDIFGKKSINRKEATKITKQSRDNIKDNKSSRNSKKSKKKEAKSHADDDFEATLLQLDISEIEQKYTTESVPSKDDPENKQKNANGSETINHDAEKEKTPVKKKKKEKRTPEKIKTPETINSEEKVKKHSPCKRKHSDSLDEGKQEENNSGKNQLPNRKKVLKTKASSSNMLVEPRVSKKKESPKKPDVYEERIDKRKQGAALYQKYLQRGGARNPDSKEIPVGADYCLAGLSFLITGVLDSLEREKADEIIKQYGGRILHQVSKNTNYVIVGDEPGPAKLAKAEQLNIKTISEDDLLEMIRSRPAGKSSDIKQSRAKSGDRTKQKSTESEDCSPSPKKSKQISKEDMEKPKEIRSPLKKENEKIVEKKRSPVKEKYTNKGTKEIAEVRSPVKNKHVKVDDTTLESKTKSSSTDNLKVKSKVVYDLNSNVATEALVEKYRPKTMKQILGQQTDKSNAKKLHAWLMNWHKNQSGEVKHAKPSPWAKNDDGAFFKAALLSGSPGIGKTTTVQVVCKELGFDLIEFNASDTRSKRLLKEEVSELMSNTTLKDFFTDSMAKPSAKQALLMDEVDGMAGNEDRGGLQELINLIKSSDIPVVCICNDRNNPKMRTLANYTFDLRFQKPRIEQIRGAMKTICFKEQIHISTEDLDRLIESTNQDIRQVINHLALYAGGSCGQEKSEKKHVNKDLKLGPWDVLKKVFSAEEHKHMTIHDKSDLFFHDYNIASLFVQENYLSAVPKAPKSELLERVAKSAESLALGDIVEKSIRSNGAWSLLPMQACYSSVIPGSLMSGYMGGQINFPSWLGRNSKANKFDRLMQEITVHARLNTGVSKEAINLDYVKHLRDAIVKPLAVNGNEGVETAMSVMNNYHLLREDLDSLVELSLWPGVRDPMQAVDSKVKAAFTRAYNKHSTAAPYAISGTAKKKTRQASQEEGFIEEDDDEVNSDENDDNVELDKMIKAKKTADSKKTTSKSKSKEKTDKPAKRGKGRGKVK